MDITSEINNVRNKIFNLSVRFLSDFQAAEDASQDILVKIVKNYDTLKDKQKFYAWALRIASNHLINLKNENDKFRYLSYDIMEQDCGLEMSPISENHYTSEESDRLLAELKISCTNAMLMCLSKDERIIYVLSSFFNINSSLGGEIMEISPDNYRQKLSRAKTKLKNFLEKNCGLVNAEATCKCRKRLQYAEESHRIDKENPIFTSKKYLANDFDIQSFISEMEKMEDYSDVFRNNPEYLMPDEIKDIVFASIK